jgi:hypothetical protein
VQLLVARPLRPLRSVCGSGIKPGYAEAYPPALAEPSTALQPCK